MGGALLETWGVIWNVGSESYIIRQNSLWILWKQQQWQKHPLNTHIVLSMLLKWNRTLACQVVADITILFLTLPFTHTPDEALLPSYYKPTLGGLWRGCSLSLMSISAFLVEWPGLILQAHPPLSRSQIMLSSIPTLDPSQENRNLLSTKRHFLSCQPYYLMLGVKPNENTFHLLNNEWARPERDLSTLYMGYCAPKWNAIIIFRNISTPTNLKESTTTAKLIKVYNYKRKEICL